MASLEELQQQLQQIQEQIHLHSIHSTKTVTTHSVGGLPEVRHLDGKNYGDWKFWMKNFLIDAGLWSCISPEGDHDIDPELDLRTLAKINESETLCCESY